MDTMPTSVAPANQRVAIAVPYNTGPLLAGVSRFLRVHRRWRIDWVEHWATHLDPETWRRWPGQGILIQAMTRQPLDVIRRVGRPAVSLSEAGWEDVVPTVHLDNRAIGRIGVEHLIARGFRYLLFVGSRRPGFPDERWRGFQEAALEAGLSPSRACVPRSHRRAAPMGAEVLRQVTAAPKPLGVMAETDVVALSVIRLCLDAGLEVPEQVGVLGVDNSQVLAELDSISLSSVEPDLDRVGFEAAQALHRLMGGRDAGPMPLRIAPRKVVARRSTDCLAGADPIVVEAMRFMRDHLHEPMNVKQLVRHLGVPRRTLDRMFQEGIGRSAAREWLLLRLERARELLQETNVPITEVARLSGFRDATYLTQCFRRKLGTSPTAYRRRLGLP